MNDIEFLAQPSFPAVTVDRIITQLAEDNIAASACIDGEVPAPSAVAFFNDLDWTFSCEGELVKVECALPTSLAFAEVAPAMFSIANAINSQAFDGRVLVGETDGSLELRADATFLSSQGLSDEQLFHALNYAVVAAQDALLNTLDAFNEIAQELNS